MLFTANTDAAEQIGNIARELDLTLTRIGKVRSGSGVIVRDDGEELTVSFQRGFDHFAKRK